MKEIEQPKIEFTVSLDTGTSEIISSLAEKAKVEEGTSFFTAIFNTVGDAENAADKINAIVFKASGIISSINREADRFLTNSVEFKIRSTEDKVYLFVIITPKDPLTKAFIEYMNTIVKPHLEVAKEEQHIRASVKFDESIEDLLQDDELLFFEPLFEALKSGFKQRFGSG